MKKIRKAMVASFKEKCTPFGAIEKYVATLKDEFNRAIGMASNDISSKAKKEMIEQLNTIYLTALSIKEYKSSSELIADVKKMRQQFMEKCKLSCKYELWDQYMFEKVIPLLDQYSSRDDSKRNQYLAIKDKEISNLQEIIVLILMPEIQRTISVSCKVR
jgi:hypothetical protein